MACLLLLPELTLVRLIGNPGLPPDYPTVLLDALTQLEGVDSTERPPRLLPQGAANVWVNDVDVGGPGAPYSAGVLLTGGGQVCG